MSGMPANPPNLIDIMAVPDMQALIQHMLTMNQAPQAVDAAAMSSSDTTSASDESKNGVGSGGGGGGGSSSTTSSSPSHDSLSPPHAVQNGDNQGRHIDQNVESIIEAVHNEYNSRPADHSQQLQQALVAMSSSSSSHSNREAFYECFNSSSGEEVRALVYSLFVVSKGESKDGYENFECFTRTKNKCRYKVRVRKVDGFFIVEERGCHSHAFDGQSFSSQGLPKQIREIVDVSFNEGWTNERRQNAVDECVARHGFPPNPKMNRQVDNRLSYLRRTKNITSSHSMVQPLLTLSSVPAAFPSLAPSSSSATSTLSALLERSSDDAFASIDVNSLAQLMVAQQEAMASLANMPQVNDAAQPSTSSN